MKIALDCRVYIVDFLLRSLVYWLMRLYYSQNYITNIVFQTFHHGLLFLFLFLFLIYTLGSIDPEG